MRRNYQLVALHIACCSSITPPCAAAGDAAVLPPGWTLEPNVNNVGGRALPGKSSGDIVFLGHFTSWAPCVAAMVGRNGTDGPFHSMTWHEPGYAGQPEPWDGDCYGVAGTEWSPSSHPKITSAKGPGVPAAPSVPPARHPHGAPPSGPCRDALDCGLNGACRAGACVCRPAWTGRRCQSLALQPALLEAGYHHVTADGKNISSWGGSVLWSDEDSRYHMWSSEFLHSCGLGSWTINSQVVHSTTEHLERPFVRAPINPIQPYFAHEPVVTRGPAGEFVMFFTGCDPTARPPSDASCRPAFAPGAGEPLNCSALGDGSTVDPHGLASAKSRLKSSDNTWMSFAASANGPWSPPVVSLSLSLSLSLCVCVCVSLSLPRLLSVCLPLSAF